MKKIIYILSALWGIVTVAEAQTAIDMRKQDIVDGVHRHRHALGFVRA